MVRESLRPIFSAGLAVALLLGACSPGPDGRWTAFEPCADADTVAALTGSRCATVEVPLRPADTASARPDSVELFVRMFPAEGTSRGTVWMLAGGPGQSGAMFYSFRETIREAFPGYDVMIPDHRGTGRSTRICPAQEALSSRGGSQLVGREWPRCYDHMRSNPGSVRAFSITNAARDVETLIERLDGSGKTYLYGVSYGTQLAHRVLLATDADIDGVILDSMVPMQRDSTWSEMRRAHVADAVGHRLLARCDNDPACRKRLGGDALGRYKALLRDIEQGEVDLPESIPGGDLKPFFGRLLDVPGARERIPAMIDALAVGESGAVEATLDTLAAFRGAFDYPGLALSIPLANTILNSENILRPDLTAADLDRQKERLEFADRLPYQLVSGREANLPLYPRDRFWGEHPDAIPPTLVVHGTLDPKTHYQGAQRHVERLREAGSVGLVSVRDASHAVLMKAPDCFSRHVRAFVTGRDPTDAWCESDAARLDFDVLDASPATGADS